MNIQGIEGVTIAIIVRETTRARPEDKEWPDLGDICDIAHTLEEAKFAVELHTYTTALGYYSQVIEEVVGNYFRFGFATQSDLQGIRLTSYGKEFTDKIIAKAWLENPEEIHAIRMKVRSLVL